MEGIGEKFQKARKARNLTIEEAARMTKIRPQKLTEIEAEDFSHFPSLAYAKGFLVIYGKFLNVDVSSYLEAFETSEHMTVDGYAYLQDNPAPKPRRTEVVRAPSSNKSSLLPLIIGIVVLVAGFSLLKLIMEIRRIPTSGRQVVAPPALTTPTPAAGPIVAPRALPADSTPGPTAIAMAPVSTATPEPTTVALATPEASSEPEVRRAEPVHDEDLVKAQALATPSPSPTPEGNRFDIRPVRKTFVRITVDGEKGRSSFERWIDVNGAPVQLRGKHIAVKVLDPSDLVIRKNGKIVAGSDRDVRFE